MQVSVPFSENEKKKVNEWREKSVRNKLGPLCAELVLGFIEKENKKIKK